MRLVPALLDATAGRPAGRSAIVAAASTTMMCLDCIGALQTELSYSGMRITPTIVVRDARRLTCSLAVHWSEPNRMNPIA